MSRRRTAKKRILLPDPLYSNKLIQMVVNQLMKNGKKSLAYKLFYDALNEIGEKTEQDPIKVIEQAILNATPLVEVKARRIAGSTYQVPLDVNPERGTALAIRWILSSCRNRSGRDMVSKLKNEFLEAFEKKGNAIRKRDEMHKMAQANKAFAKYRI